MTETIRIETPADEASLPIIRMVIGGVGARCDLSLDELDDIYLAVGELWRVATELEPLSRYALELEVEAQTLSLRAGPFHSPDLRARLEFEPTTQLCLNLCQLLDGVLESFSVQDGDGEFSVTMTKMLREHVT
jgi:hypothetical protein